MRVKPFIFVPNSGGTLLPGEISFVLITNIGADWCIIMLQVISGPLYTQYMNTEQQDQLLEQALPTIASQLMLIACYPAKSVDDFLARLSQPPPLQPQQQHRGLTQFGSPASGFV